MHYVDFNLMCIYTFYEHQLKFKSTHTDTPFATKSLEKGPTLRDNRGNYQIAFTNR